jgi:hypothetical protein
MQGVAGTARTVSPAEKADQGSYVEFIWISSPPPPFHTNPA